jgi:hypothetical protein
MLGGVSPYWVLREDPRQAGIFDGLPRKWLGIAVLIDGQRLAYDGRISMSPLPRTTTLGHSPPVFSVIDTTMG